MPYKKKLLRLNSIIAFFDTVCSQYLHSQIKQPSYVQNQLLIQAPINVRSNHNQNRKLMLRLGSRTAFLDPNDSLNTMCPQYLHGPKSNCLPIYKSNY